MKQLLLPILFVFSIQTIAQNWAPINSTEQFNYSLGDANVITHAIKVDSVQVNGQDSVMYFNRVMAPCDTCCVEVLLDGSEGEFWIDQQPNLMGFQVAISTDVWNFIFQDSSTVLHPHANLGETWEFSNGITAEVTEANETVVFGTLDSLKIISLSNGTSYQLSKNHGLIGFSNSNSEEFNLTGIQGRDLGQIAPKFEEIFDFEVGDLFQYRTTKNVNYSGGDFSTVYSQYGIEQRLVTGVEQYPDSVILSYDFIRNDTTYNFVEFSYEYNIENGSAQEVYKLGDFQTLSQQPGTPQTHISAFHGNYVQDLLSLGFAVSESGREIMHFGGYNFMDESTTPDYLSRTYNISFYCIDQESLEDETSIAKGSSEFFSYLATMNLSNFSSATGYNCALSKGLGYISRNRFREWNGSSENGEYLVGFVKSNGETEGIILSESVLLNLNEITETEFKIFPNPTNDQFTISSSERIKSISLVNSLGEEIKKVEGDGVSQTIDLSQLSSGVYLIVTGLANGEFVQERILKL